MENKDMKELNNEELDMVNGGAAFLQIQGMLASKLGIAKEAINLQSKIVEELGADSLDVVDVLKGVAQEFNVELDRPYKDFKSVADICNFARPKNSRNL